MLIELQGNLLGTTNKCSYGATLLMTKYIIYKVDAGVDCLSRRGRPSVISWRRGQPSVHQLARLAIIASSSAEKESCRDVAVQVAFERHILTPGFYLIGARLKPCAFQLWVRGSQRAPPHRDDAGAPLPRRNELKAGCGGGGVSI